MAIRVTCPNPECGAVASVEEQSLGRRGRCRKCGHVFALTRPGGEPASAIAGDASAWKGSAPARPPASPTDLPEQFGRYRIMKLLGQGGMGAVYLAHDVKLDRRVALKVPFLHPGDGPQAIQRFEREARLAATLDHPNLCPILDVGEVDGTPYLTMPYIKGKPLSEAIPRGQVIPEAQAATVTRKLALALAEAHARGIIHRDLKPGNIMVNWRRELVIMDFGLARAVDGDDRPITRTGHVLGTALYMAPEQAAGDLAATGPAADVYSLGVILYELLTGLRPFEGPWSLVIGLKNVKDPDPPSKHRPGLDPALDAICLKAIAKEPAGRYATMAKFAGALGDFLEASASAIPGGSPEGHDARSLADVALQAMASLHAEVGIARPRLARVENEGLRITLRARYLAAAATALLLISVIFLAAHKGRNLSRSTESGPGSTKAKPIDIPATSTSAGASSPETAAESYRPIGTATDPIRADLEKFRGTWDLIRVEREGEALGLVAATATYDGDRFTLKRGDEVYGQGVVILHPERSPKEIESCIGNLQGERIAGIYRIEGDDLEICFAKKGEGRPIVFSTSRGTGTISRTYRRTGSIGTVSRRNTLLADSSYDSIYDPLKSFEPILTDGILRGNLQHQTSQEGERLRMEDGLLVGGGEGAKVAFIERRFRDFDLRAEVMMDEGSKAVLLFRCGQRDNGFSGNRVRGYSVGLGGGTDAANAGALHKYHFMSGETALLQSKFNKSPASNKWFWVEVRVKGSNFKAQIDGGPIVEASDPDNTFIDGFIGFEAMSRSKMKVRKIEIRTSN